MKSYKHSGNLGDLIYALPAIKAGGGGALYIGNYPIDIANASQPREMPSEMVAQIIQLLRELPYLSQVEVYEGQTIDFDLDQWRTVRPLINISEAHLQFVPDDFDLSEPWIENITPRPVADIIISRCLRWRSPYHRLNWKCLAGYEARCAFLGFEDERDDFVKETGLDIPRLEPANLIEFASIIKGSRLFVGNQSFGYALAEAMKHPRIQELWLQVPNCLPQSDNGHLFLSRNLIQRYLNGNSKKVVGKVKKQNVALRNSLFLNFYQCREKLRTKAVNLRNRMIGKIKRLLRGNRK